jgi:hypothetical protein
MSRGRTRLTLRVSDTLLTDLTIVAQRRGVDHSTVVREALAAYLEPRRAPATAQAQATPPPLPAATDLLHSLDPATRAQLTEGMSRFQCSAIDLVRVITRQWAQAMKDPRVWRGWRP